MGRKYDTRQRENLLSPERHELLRPADLLRSLGLKPGDTLADIGCGPGFFAIPAAEIVGPRGRVLAADVQGEMLAMVRQRVMEQELSNVRLVKTSDVEIPLPPACADLALLAFTLDEVDQRARLLHRVGRLLKPGGHIAVVEWEKRDEADGPPIEERISQEELLKDAEAAGLRVTDQRELNEHHYLCQFVPTGR
jgi:ubiquinone/menaquinone biosynthesis C-methylase UbiE